LIRGYDANVLALLRPFVAALPEQAALNVNIASAEVLAATLPTTLSTARIITAQQQNAPFTSSSDMQGRLFTYGIKDVDPKLFDVSTRYFLASGRAHFGEATTRMQVLLDRKTPYPVIIWQKIL
jgi:type II secretory pathway component PulK